MTTKIVQMLLVAWIAFGAAFVPIARAGTVIGFVPTEGANALPEPIPSQLLAALTASKDVRIVERERVADCLTELKLNATDLVNADAALRLGKLLAADVIVTGELVSPESDSGQPLCVFRAIDSRTGIVLRDELLSVKDAEVDISPVVREVIAAADTAQLPDEKRRYVGVVTLSSEEPGSQLDPVAESLEAFIEHDLMQAQGVVVLERKRIDKLIAEKDLTGLDQQLKTSTILIDGGVRRGADAQQLVVTLQLRHLDGGGLRSTSFSGAAGDLAAVRRGVAAAALGEINATIEPRKAMDPVVESAEFARRAAHLLANKQKTEAATCAEAAIALAPSAEHLELAEKAWESLTHDDTWPPIKDPPVADQLRAGLRAEQIKELQYHLIAEGHAPAWQMQNISSFSWALRDCKPSEVLSTPDTPEHRLWRQLKQAAMENYSRFLSFALDHKKSAMQDYSEKLLQVPILAESQQEREQIITECIAGADAEVDAGRAGDDQLGYFYSCLQHAQVRYLHEKPVDDRAFWKKFTTHREPYVRMIAYRNLMTFGGSEGEQAGIRMFDTILKEAPADPLHTERTFQNETTDQLFTFAMSAFRPDARDYLETFLATAEKNNDSNALVRWPYVVAELVRAQGDALTSSRTRILALIDRVPPDTKLSDNTRYLRELLNQEEAGVASRHRPANVGTGAWSGYQMRQVAVGNLDPAFNNLCGFNVVGEDAIGVWCNWNGTPVNGMIARVAIIGGAIHPLGSLTDVKPWDFTCISCSNDGVCIAQRNKGLYVAVNGHVDFLQVKDGLPAGEVKSAAWLDGMLYLGFDGSIVSFDPTVRTFKLLCSTRAVAGKSVLDGGAEYRVAGMIPDGKRHVVWLSVVDNNNPHVDGPRPGLWKYDPAQAEFTQLRQGDDFGVIQWTGQKILCSGYKPSLFDPETSKTEPLIGYNKWISGLCTNHRDCAMFQHDILFALSGYLCTPDGLRADMPRQNSRFDLVDTDKDGFVVAGHYGELFTIQPVNPAATK